MEIISSKKVSLLNSVPRPDCGVDEPDKEKAPEANPLGCYVSEGHKLPQSSESKHGLFFHFFKKNVFLRERIILKYLLCSHDVACFSTLRCDSRRSETRSSTSISGPETHFYPPKRSL